MSSIQTGIELQDRFSAVLYGIMDAVNLATFSMETMNQSLEARIDTSELMGARAAIDQATAALNAMNEAAQNAGRSPVINRPEPAQPPSDPYQWQSGSMDIFTNSGVERFQREVESTNRMMDMLCETQERIAQRANAIEILPANAIQDINGLNSRMQMIQQRIQEIEGNPINMGTNAANMELERLREQLSRATQQQNILDQAMNDMDIDRANAAYLRLLETIGDTERRIRDGTDEMGRFDNVIRECGAHARSVSSGFEGWQKAIIVANQGISLLQNTLGRLGVTDMSSAFDRIDTMERFQRTITIMAGDSALASAALSRLKNTTLGTAYGLDTASRAAQGFLTRGMSLGAATDQVRIWADAVSFYGEGTNNQLESVIDAIGKMYSKGKVEVDQLDRLFDAGIGAAEIYAQAVGECVSSVKDDLSSGAISSAEFIETISQALDNGISNGAAKEAGATWATTFANIDAAVTRGMVNIINNLDAALASHGLPSSMEMITDFGARAEQVLNAVGDAMGDVVDVAVSISDFFVDNWSIIAPIIGGIVTAVGLYTAALTANTVAQVIHSAQEVVAAAAKYRHARAVLANTMAHDAETLAVARDTVAQTSFNAVLLACPITWVAACIIIIIAGLMAFSAWLAKTSGAAQTGFGIMCGVISLTGTFMKNLGLTVANVALGIGNAIWACASNTGIAFYNAIHGIISWWYDLLSTVITVVAGICAELNKIPFIEFDYSGLTSAADNYASKAADAASKKMEYTKVSDAFYQGYSTFDTFEDGWATKAFQAGTNWGDKKMDDISQFFKGFEPGENQGDGIASSLESSGLGENLNNINGNTGDIKDSLDITEEDLQYLKDIAEREVIDRTIFTTVSVDMGGVSNVVNEKSDLDSIGAYLVSSLQEQLTVGMEGV